MGVEETSGKKKRRGSQFQTADPYRDDLYRDPDPGYGSYIHEHVSNRAACT